MTFVRQGQSKLQLCRPDRFGQTISRRHRTLGVIKVVCVALRVHKAGRHGQLIAVPKRHPVPELRAPNRGVVARALTILSFTADRQAEQTAVACRPSIIRTDPVVVQKRITTVPSAPQSRVPPKLCLAAGQDVVFLQADKNRTGGKIRTVRIRRDVLGVFRQDVGAMGQAEKQVCAFAVRVHKAITCT